MADLRGVEIESVKPGSVAEKTGFKNRDRLISIDGNNVRDIIDVLYYGQEGASRVQILREAHKTELSLPATINTAKMFSSDISFKPFRIKTCNNNCVFCFVSQLPKGLRKSLYIKDEDYRMSFLYGSYITLTNLSEDDKKRIVSQRLSPLYISVHATDSEKRNYILGNKNASPVLDEIRYLAKRRIRMHAQIVVCPGINDSLTLERTIADLYRFYPYILSIAVVPVGLTAYRKRKLRGFDRVLALETLDIVESFKSRFRKKHGEGIVYGADEIYLKAERPFPEITEYDDMPQLENGVGMIPFFMQRVKKLKLKKLLSGISASKERRFVTFTGSSFFPFLRDFINQLQGYGLNIQCYQVQNTFFGDSVTVAGLLGGRDIIKTLADTDISGSTLIIPDVCLKEGEEVFIDDVTVADLESILHVKTMTVPSTPEGFIAGIERGCNLIFSSKEKRLQAKTE